MSNGAKSMNHKALSIFFWKSIDR